MSQILHIFKKDTLRFRIEIAICLLLQFLFAVHAPAQWSGRRQVSLEEALQFLFVLLPLSWGLLVTRVIQAETLVGDRQFWITRPYEWKKLLGAKALFLAVWIGMPYLAAQFAILHAAGFAAVAYAGTALFNLLLISGVFLLPLAALATMTENFARFTLTLLGVVVALVTLAACISWLTSGEYSAWNPMRDHVSFPLELAMAILVILVQYATRRVWVARTISIATALALLGVTCLYQSQVLIDRAYAGSSPAPVQVTIAADRQITTNSSGRIITVPLQYSDVPQGYAVRLLNARLTLIAADGTTWTSPWQEDLNTYSEPISSGTREEKLLLRVDGAMFARIRHQPVTLRLILAGDLLQTDGSFAIPYPRKSEIVPGLGICSLYFSDPTIHCRNVIRYDSPLVSITAEGRCFKGRTIWLPGDRSIVGAVLSPIETYFNFMLWSKDDPCYTSNILVSPYHLVKRVTTALTVSNVNFADTSTSDTESK